MAAAANAVRLEKSATRRAIVFSRSAALRQNNDASIALFARRHNRALKIRIANAPLFAAASVASWQEKIVNPIAWRLEQGLCIPPLREQLEELRRSGKCLKMLTYLYTYGLLSTWGLVKRRRTSM
ncbi:MAG: hypothetical protein MJH11_21400 [Lentisphaeria bacterium]|nr:hypothetical protein [Lentisphaeria bacterium]